MFLARFAKDSGRSEKIAGHFVRRRCSFWPVIIGPAMCANCRTSSNAPARWHSGTQLEAGDIQLDSPRNRAGSSGIRLTAFLPEGMTLDQWEDEMIREALKRAGGNKSQAARLLGLSRNALRYRLSKIGIDDNDGE